MVTLKKSGVVYIDSTHKYTFEGRELKGITGLLHAFVFPDMYKDVPSETLKAAAQKGTMIHEQVELVASLGIDPSLDSVKAFVELINHDGYEIIGNEYVLRIGEDHASAIDLVMHKVGAPDDEVEIWDIKTTYSVNREYVRWQNSIYKVGLEELNENLKVVAIKCMWLRDDAKRGTICKLIDLGNPRPKEDVQKLFLCAKENKPFNGCDGTPDYIADNEVALLDLEEKIANLTEMRDELKAAIFEGMVHDKLTSFKTANYTYSIKKGYDKTQIDTKAFDVDDEELYQTLLDKYKKVIHVKDSFQMKKIV